jgi:hypothetical protein
MPHVQLMTRHGGRSLGAYRSDRYAKEAPRARTNHWLRGVTCAVQQSVSVSLCCDAMPPNGSSEFVSSKASSKVAPSGVRMFRKEDIKETHLIIDDNVYDIADYSKVHPGGKAIFTHAGKDATSAFHSFHANSKVSYAHLKELKVGELSREALPESTVSSEKPFEKECRALRDKFRKDGLFESE